MNTEIPASEWSWFGTPGHLCVAPWCRFHLCTLVGSYLVSTVGEWVPTATSRAILGKRPSQKDSDLGGEREEAGWVERNGFQEIGAGRTYETMVFRAGAPCNAKGCCCGLPEIDGSEIDVEGYRDRKSATVGHRAMCEKYAREPVAARSVE